MLSLSRGRSALAATCLLVCSLLLASCSGGGPKLYPVTGKVMYEGKPAAGATVVFHPVNGSGPDTLRPGATVDKEGKFVLRTYPHGEGAPEGEYTVLVTWFEDPPPGQTSLEPKSKIPARYSNASQSGLKATVKPGNNDLEPFMLTKQSR